MIRNDITKDDLISAIRGINIKDFSLKELEYLEDLLKIKGRQLEEEITKRKHEGKK